MNREKHGVVKTLLSGHRFGNYKLRRNTKISFDVIDNKSVVVVILEAGIAESGENEREAIVNLESFISDILDDYKADPEKRYGHRLLEQMRLLDEIMEQTGSDIYFQKVYDFT